MIRFWLFRSPIGSPSDKPKHKYFSHVYCILSLHGIIIIIGWYQSHLQTFQGQIFSSSLNFWRFFSFRKNELSYSFGGLVEGYKNTRVTYLVHQRPLSFEFLWVAPDPDGIMTSDSSWSDHLILMKTEPVWDLVSKNHRDFGI